MNKEATAQAGTARAILSNMVTGVSAGFEKKININWGRLQSSGKRKYS